jgi:ATP-dependent RNA helicase DeaD
MPRQIQNLAQRFMREPELIRIEAKEVTMPSIEQMYLEVPEKQKFDVLCRMMDINPTELVIVFGRTKRRVDELSEALSKRGYSAEGLHGDLTQNRRDIVLRKFKEGTIEVLVATDVAARGLDISGVSHVYNFDIPQDPESYVHRIGRTGRAGKTGVAITFVTPREIGHLRLIEQVIKRKIARKPVPSLVEAFKGQQQITVEKLLRVIEEEDIQKYRGVAEDLLEETDSVTLLSAALKLLTKEPDQGSIELSQEPPLRVKSYRPDPRDNRRTGGGPRSGDWQPRHKSGPNRSNNRGNTRRP